MELLITDFRDIKEITMNSYIDITDINGRTISINTNKICYMYPIFNDNNKFLYTILSTSENFFHVKETPVELKHRIYMAEREVTQ